MKSRLIILALLAAALSGCTTTLYVDPTTGARFERSSFLTKQNIGKVEAKANVDGSKSLSIEGYSNEQTEIAAAVAGSVAKALTAGK
jgi:hypothetical protein